MSFLAAAERVLTGARVVAGDEVFAGTVQLRAGRIAAVDRGGTAVAAAEDLDGDLLLPGLVEVHTDNLEKHLLPRPGVLWDPLAAVIMHDAQCAAAGITTVLDAVVLGDRDHGGVRSQMQHTSIDAIRLAQAEGLLRIDHHLHLRCEVATHDIVEVFARYAADPRLRLVSVMDHTPGQRQWRDLDKYRQYQERNGRYSDEQFEQLLAALRDDHEAYASGHRRRVVDTAHAHGVVLASHDDTDVEHVEQARAEGVRLSEFPTTLAAAQAARAAGIGIVMGAPNLVRGGSHSGNVAAGHLAERHLLDVLSSDYVPASLLHAAFLLDTRHGWGLPAAVAAVSRAPARALGLEDRGQIAPGLRADLIRVRTRGDAVPVVRASWVAGARVL